MRFEFKHSLEKFMRNQLARIFLHQQQQAKELAEKEKLVETTAQTVEAVVQPAETENVELQTNEVISEPLVTVKKKGFQKKKITQE